MLCQVVFSVVEDGAQGHTRQEEAGTLSERLYSLALALAGRPAAVTKLRSVSAANGCNAANLPSSDQAPKAGGRATTKSASHL
jgi:hypothetical protein